MFAGTGREHHQLLDRDGEVQLEAEELRTVSVPGVAEHRADALKPCALLAVVVGVFDGDCCNVVIGHLGLSFFAMGIYQHGG